MINKNSGYNDKKISKILFFFLSIVFTLLYAIAYNYDILSDKVVTYNGVGSNIDSLIKIIQYYDWNQLTYVAIFIIAILIIFIGTYDLTFLDRKIINFLIVIFTLIPRIVQIGDLPVYDADLYLQSFNKLSNSFTVQNMVFWEHPTYAYALIYGLVCKLFGNPLIGVQIVNIVLSETVIFMFFDIISSVFDESTELNVIGTLIFGNAPMFLGLTSSISPDYALGIISVVLYWSLIRQKKICFVISAICLCLTKEVGIIILAGVIIGHIIWLIINKNNPFKNFYVAFTLLLELLLGAIYLYKSSKGLIWGGKVDESLKIDIDFIVHKIKSISLLNFYYVLWLLIGIILIILIRQKVFINYAYLLFPISSGFICYFLFLCIYKTYNNVRYHLPLELFIFIYFELLLLILVNCINIKFRISIKYSYIIILLVLMIQAFVTIDPMMRLAFTRVNTGSIDMINTLLEARNERVYYMAEYNHQYTYVNRLFDLILSENNYNADMDIIFYGDEVYKNISWIGGMETIGYDKDIKKRVYLYHDKEEIKISPITFLGNCFAVIDENDLKDEAIYIILPDFNIDENISLIQLSEYYDIGNKVEVNIRGRGKAYFYRMRKKC